MGIEPDSISFSDVLKFWNRPRLWISMNQKTFLSQVPSEDYFSVSALLLGILFAKETVSTQQSGTSL